MSEVKKVQTLIIGGGPAGMAAAMELSRAHKDFLLIEKQAQVGGLAKTYVLTEEDGSTFRTDNGPHRFFSKNRYLYDFIEDLLHEHWIVVHRQTRQFIRGKFYDYPVNPRQVLQNTGPWFIIRVLFDYLLSQIEYRLFRRPIKNFRDYAIASFGRTLANFNIINYTEKIWGISTKDLHPDWAKQRVKGLDLLSFAKNALKIGAVNAPKSLVDTFYYPEFGTGVIYETIKKRLQQEGYEVRVQSQPTAIYHEQNRITAVEVQTGEDSQRIEVDNLIESIHLDDFLQLLRPLPPAAVLEAAAKLQWRSQVYLFLTLNKERVTNDQWVYFPEPEVPFDRMSEMKNFSPQMAPADKTSLFIEFFCNYGDARHSATADELLALVLPFLEKFDFLKAEEIRQHYVFRGQKDYPIYEISYREHLGVIKEYLKGFSNLHYIGRPGRFQYTNQDHSLEMGMLAASSIITGKPIDLELIGTETEYFEKGFIPRDDSAKD